MPYYTRFDKNSKEAVVVETREFKGKPYVDVRTYFTNTEGELCPTQKGVMLKPELAEQVAKAMLEAAAELEGA